MEENEKILSDDEFDEKLRIQNIAESWIWQEPLLYDVVASHKISSNKNMRCTLRTGQGRIEYNAKFTKEYDNATLEKLLKVEAMRIVLKHPYTRRPDGCRDDACVCASDVTIVQNCDIKIDVPNEIVNAIMFGLPWDFCYEEYCNALTQLFNTLPPGESAEKTKINGSGVGDDIPDDTKDCFESDQTKSGNNPNDSESSPSYIEDDNNALVALGTDETDTQPSGGKDNLDLQSIRDNAEERSELWDEDPLMEDAIQEKIEEHEKSHSCGSVPGNFIQDVLANKKPKLHYKKILSNFRASLISDTKKLTRMRPSRRYGFKQMGSRYDYTVNILVAVDTSGSISDSDLKVFFSVVNQFFKYGVKKLDMIQFDHEIQGEVQSMKKSVPKIKVRGRGGTSFQPAYDFCFKHKEYNGLIFLTDGYAFEPQVPDSFNTRVVWILDCKADWQANSWLKKFGFTTYIQDD